MGLKSNSLNHSAIASALAYVLKPYSDFPFLPFHLSRSPADCGGTTEDFAASFLHSPWSSAFCSKSFLSIFRLQRRTIRAQWCWHWQSWLVVDRFDGDGDSSAVRALTFPKLRLSSIECGYQVDGWPFACFGFSTVPQFIQLYLPFRVREGKAARERR